MKYITSPRRLPINNGRPSGKRPADVFPRIMFAPRRADCETPVLLVVWARITERDPSFLTVIDADFSVGFTLLVMTLTIFPEVLYTVNTTAAAPCAAACGANRMRPVNEFCPEVTVGFISVEVELGKPFPVTSLTEDGDVSGPMLIAIGGEAADVLPAESVAVTDIDQVPSLSVGRSHDVATPTT